jgi:hypothetical protein
VAIAALLPIPRRLREKRCLVNRLQRVGFVLHGKSLILHALRIPGAKDLKGRFVSDISREGVEDRHRSP